MNSLQLIALAFLIGVVAGLRSLTAPAIVAWGAHRGWLNVQNTPASFMASTAAVIVFTVLAVGEFVVDQLPSTPSRLAPPGLIARIILGGLSGAVIALTGEQSIALGALVGALGGVTGAFAGYHARAGLVRALKIPDVIIGLLEDAVAILGGVFIVSRF